MRIISFLLRNSRGTFVLAIIAGIISGAAHTGLLALISFSLSQRRYSGPVLVWSFVILCLIAPLTRIASELILIRLGQQSVFDLRMQLCRRILAVPLRQQEEIGAPRLMAALTDDVLAITNAIVFIPILSINIAVVIGCLVYLGWLSWSILLTVFGFILIGIISYQLPVVKAMRHLRLAREEEDQLYGHFRALVEGFKELKIHRQRREVFLSSVLQSTAAAYCRHNITGQSIYTAASSWGQLLVFVVIGLILFMLTGLREVNPLALTGYTLTILYMMTPLQVILNTLPNLGRANVALDKVEQLGLSLAVPAGEAKADETDRRAEPETVIQSLELSGVTHSYYVEGEENIFTLGPIDLSFDPGEIVFLVGGNGSGKTTLAKLLMGLYAPEAGEIRLNGQPITDDNRDDYRQLYSAVFADFYLFESLLGLESAELDETARAYLARLQLAHKVKVKENALSTTKLSQGQRKRLALLTAYLENRPVYLFDEWAADQDPFFKEVFYLQLLPELKARGKTVFVISHDERYYFVGDRIVKLDDGKVEYSLRPDDSPKAQVATLHQPAPVAVHGNEDVKR